jgi:hypothetical protein
MKESNDIIVFLKNRIEVSYKIGDYECKKNVKIF